jgi:hypothetical protein
MIKVPTASPVQNLRQAHRALLADLQRLEEMARAHPVKSKKDLLDALHAAHAHVAEHFRFEERDGYFDAVRMRAPHQERAIQHLAAEHRQLEESLRGLLREAGRDNEDVRGHVIEWVRSIRDHETRENKLVQEVFYRDVAAED